MSAAKTNFLYAQIKTSILDRIAHGEWGPGSFLPSEMMLAEEYGVSQGTLRKALNELTLEKRLVRFQGKGTAVAVFDADSALFPFFMLYDSDGKRVYPLSKTDSIHHTLADADEAEALHLKKGSEVIRIHRIRVLDDEPVINELVVIPSALFPNFSLDFNSLPNTLYGYYYQMFGIVVAHAVETLNAVVPDAHDQKNLHIDASTPLLEVKRTAYDLEGKAVEFRRSRINTHHHHYRIELH